MPDFDVDKACRPIASPERRAPGRFIADVSTQMQASTGSVRLAYLDGLRGWAALAVVLSHGMVAIDFALYTGSPHDSRTSWDVWMSGTPFGLVAAAGNTAVCFFFHFERVRSCPLLFSFHTRNYRFGRETILPPRRTNRHRMRSRLGLDSHRTSPKPGRFGYHTFFLASGRCRDRWIDQRRCPRYLPASGHFRQKAGFKLQSIALDNAGGDQRVARHTARRDARSPGRRRGPSDAWDCLWIPCRSMDRFIL